MMSREEEVKILVDYYYSKIKELRDKANKKYMAIGRLCEALSIAKQQHPECVNRVTNKIEKELLKVKLIGHKIMELDVERYQLEKSCDQSDVH